MTPRTGLDLQTILEAAAKIADEQGMDNVTLAILSKKLGIRSPSLYNHVDGLNGLRQKLAEYGLTKLYDTLIKAVIGKSGDDAVFTLGEAYVHFARRHPGLYEATFHAPDPADTDLQQAGQEIVDLVVRVLEPFDLDQDSAVHAVRGLRSICHGFASLEQKGGFGIPLDVDTSFRMLLETFVAGLHELKRLSNKK
ncbi:MAG: WHG domain-containing protein [Bacillaceae bacterium]|nr:WHG domain-containing protein [Bacillaceae bacterium]